MRPGLPPYEHTGVHGAKSPLRWLLTKGRHNVRFGVRLKTYEPHRLSNCTRRFLSFGRGSIPIARSRSPVDAVGFTGFPSRKTPLKTMILVAVGRESWSRCTFWTLLIRWCRSAAWTWQSPHRIPESKSRPNAPPAPTSSSRRSGSLPPFGFQHLRSSLLRRGTFLSQGGTPRLTRSGRICSAPGRWRGFAPSSVPGQV